MIVAAHQPSYLPWLGYFDKMAKADLFVVMDGVPYKPQRYQDRGRIKGDHGAAWLAVPVAIGSDRIADKRIDNSVSWQQQTSLVLANHYRNAPHFARYLDDLFFVYSQPWRRLVDLDLYVINLGRRWLGIKTPMILASELALEGTDSTARLIDLCGKVGARAYLSGSGSSTKTLDAERMGRAGIGVIWQHFEHPTYPQSYPEHGFVSHLAFLDLVFNCGESSRDVLFGCGHPIHLARSAA